MEGKVIVVTSGKGGVGKTTTTASLGAALALEGNKVILVDMDLGLRNLDLVLGLENRVVFNIVDVIKDKCKINQASVKDRKVENLFLMPASQSDNKDAINPEEMAAFCSRLKKEYDFVLMDCPAGIERGFENAVAGADEAIVVCTPEVSSIRDADRIIGLLFSKNIEPKLIINRIMPRMVEAGQMLSHEDVLDVLSIDLIGIVEQDEQVIVATNTGSHLVSDKTSKAGNAFIRIAQRLNGNPDLPIVIPKADEGILKKIKRKMSFA